MKHLNLKCLFFLCLLTVARTLTAADTTSVYIYQLNHYYTLQALSALTLDRPNSYLKAMYQNRSNIYAKPSDQTRIKQENLVDARFLYKFKESIMSGPAVRWYTLSDEQHSSQNDYRNTRLGLAGMYRKKVTLTGSTGYFNEQRQSLEDQGWYANMEFMRPNNQVFTPFIRWQYDKTPERSNYTTDNRFNIITPFEQDIFNHFTVNFKETRREYYIDPANPGRTEVRTTTNREIKNSFSYRLPLHVRLRYNVRFSSATDYLNFFVADSSANRKRDSYQFQNQIFLSRLKNNLHLRGGFSIDQNQDKSSANRDEIRLPADYKYSRTTLSALSSFRFSKTDSLSMRYQVSLLHFDTPDSNNTDDKDELSYVFNPQLSLALSPYLRWNLSGQVYLHHLIYLHSSRSGQNHWNRVYTIRSNLSLSIPAKLTWSSTQSISSNYFIYDYEDSAFINVSSRIFRSLYIDQSVDYFLSPGWSLKYRISGRFEDDGLLDWDLFIQEKYSDRIQVSQEFLINHRGRYFQIYAGPVNSRRWFYQNTPTTDKTLIQYVYRNGLSIGCQFRTNIRIKYTLEAIHQKNQKRVYNQNGYLQINFIL